jgi:F420-dependent oxidoreductase-like protein
MDLAIMLEGQNGLNWENFKPLAKLVDEAGFAGLYRSDHYTNGSGPDIDSLELWVSLAWLADNTSHIDFGPLVTPVSFRHPTQTARMARDVDDLSAGRLHLGLGAGWQEREHHKYGWDLLDVPERFQRFEEGIQVIRALLRDDQPVSFAGRYFYLDEASLLPRPDRPGGPPILVGGNGMKLTLPLAARYADMWNSIYLTPDALKKRLDRLDALLKEAGRQPGDVHRSMMTGIWFSPDPAAIQRRIDVHPRYDSAEQLRERGVIVGTPDEVIPQLKELEAIGCDRVMLQWLELDDLEGLEALAETVLPAFQ